MMSANVNTFCSFGSTTLNIVNTQPQLCHDVGQLLQDEFFTDASLKCDSVIYRVHKCILSARSPVFNAMFKTDMLEGLGSPVNITDVQPDTLLAMLNYIYSGRTEGMTCPIAAKLLIAADKYQLEELKTICSNHLKAATSLETVVQILAIGDFYDLSLKAHAVSFICGMDNFSMLELKEEWISLSRENPRLVIQVMADVVKHKEQKISKLQNQTSRYVTPTTTMFGGQFHQSVQAVRFTGSGFPIDSRLRSTPASNPSSFSYPY